MYRRKFKSLFRFLFVSDKWNIGYIKQSEENLIKEKKLSSKINWLKEDAADYSADPFVVRLNNQLHIYYEYLSKWNNQGKIYLLNNFDFKTKRIVTGLDPKLHLSYPFVFKDGENIYCIPETGRANEIALYEIDENDPTHLRNKKILLAGEQYVDSSIIKYNGKYWLFTNKRSCKDLFIYYSDSLNENYIPHKMNPIPSDKMNYRNGGSLFIVDGLLYRPTQNSTLRYGGSLIINKIKTLTIDQYESEFNFELLPSSPYDKGLHHISFENNLIVIDGKRERVSLLQPIKLFFRYLRH